MVPGFYINHVLSTALVGSAIFDHLIDRAASAAPAGVRVSRSLRPERGASVWHYHRANLEWRLRPRSVVTVHHDLHDRRPWLALRYFLPRYREAAIVHCLNTTQQQVLSDYGIANARVVPHGVDRRVFPLPTEPRRWTGPRLRLGFFSRRYPSGYKGEHRFDALLAQLDPDRVAFVLVGAGRGHEAQLARARGFAVDCWEHLPYRLMAEAYARIDALLIMSRVEGGPASLPEALGAGVPVICTRAGMCVDFVRNGVNGIFIEGRPASDGAQIMALLDKGGDPVAGLNQGAFEAAGDVPGWDSVMAEWHDLAQSAAAAGA